MSYKQRLPANTGLAAGNQGGRQVFAYGNRPKGIVSKDVEITKEYPTEAHKEAIIDIFKELDEVNDISISTNKLPYIELESIIDLNIEDRQTITKSILENYSGNILDIPNGKEKILDRFKNYQPFLKDTPNQSDHLGGLF